MSDCGGGFGVTIDAEFIVLDRRGEWHRLEIDEEVEEEEEEDI